MARCSLCKENGLVKMLKKTKRRQLVVYACPVCDVPDKNGWNGKSIIDISQSQ